MAMTAYRMLKIPVAYLAVFIVFAFVVPSWDPGSAQQGQTFDQQPQVRLNARINYNVDWDIKEGQSQYKGYLRIQAHGRLKVNKGFSSMSFGLPAMSIWYEIEQMNASYQYEEVYNTKDPHCVNPLYRYKGGGTGYAVKVPAPGNLNVNYLGSFAKSQKKLLDMTPAGPQQDVLIDRYLFAYKLKDIKVPGQKWKAVSEPCEREEVERTIAPGMNIHFKFTDDGKMKGSKKWTAKFTHTPHLSVAISNLPESLNKKPLTPEQSMSGNVTYSLDWEIKEPPAVQIFRVDPNDPDDVGDDITDGKQDIYIGEKVKLKAVVFPMPKRQSEAKGKWALPGKVLKDWKGSHAQSTRTEIPGKDYEKQEIEFFWFEGTDSGVERKVVFKPDGGTVTGETTFKVKRPSVSLVASAGVINHYRQMEMGLLLDEATCCAVYPPEVKENEKWCNDTRKELEALASIHRPKGSLEDDYYQKKLKEYKERCIYHGLQYEGITFYGRILGDGKGELQYVQLINVSRDTLQGVKPWGLDGCYPYPSSKQLSLYKATDMPGIGDPGASKTHIKNAEFKMYLMYRPEPKYENAHAWVPVKRVDWIWGGGIECDANGDCRHLYAADRSSPSPQTKEQKQYPKWRRCN